MKPRVSVIIPAYNAEETLKRCLDSVFAQDFDSYEVILVNDGSIDRTIQVARGYQKHPNFVLIDQRNVGVSRARWAGLAASQGEYIAFVDVDDYIASNMLKKMYSKAKENNADIVVSNWFRVEGDKLVRHTPYKDIDDILNPGDSISQIIFRNDNTGLWNKLWRKRLFSDVLLQETFDLRYGEDLLICLNVFPNARRLSFISDSLYFNVCNSASVTQNLSLSTISDYLFVLEKLRMSFWGTSDRGIGKEAQVYYFSKLLQRYQQLCVIGKQDEEIKVLKRSILKKCRDIPLPLLVSAQLRFTGLLKVLFLKSGLFPFLYSIWISSLSGSISKSKKR